MRLIFSVGSALVCLLTSCSIKEDRSVCPCWLDIKCDQIFVLEHRTSPLRFYAFNQDKEKISFSSDGVLDITEPNVLSRLAADDYVYEDVLKRGVHDICCESGLTNGRIEGNVFYYQQNGTVKYTDADSLYSHCTRKVDCTGEFAYDTLAMHKEFTAVKLRIIGKDGEKYPYLPVIKSDTYGMDITDPGLVFTGEFAPVHESMPTDSTAFKAAYIYVPQYSENGVYYFNLPRQTALDENIRVELFRQGCDDPMADKPDFIAGRFIGCLINEIETFSWTDADLGDIYIEVDFSKLNIGIRVLPWDVEELPDIEI